MKEKKLKNVIRVVSVAMIMVMALGVSFVWAEDVPGPGTVGTEPIIEPVTPENPPEILKEGFEEDEEGNVFYYIAGEKQKGWQKIGKNTYYFGRSTGKMYKGVNRIKNNVYTFNDKGILKRTVYGDKKAVCLTYDDGPSANTAIILDTLKKNDALATFFVVGSRVPSYKNNFKAVVDYGCQIGNHTYTHAWLNRLSADGIKSQMERADRIIEKYSGKEALVCRTPGGQLNETIKSNVGLPIILWSIDPVDWRTRNADSTYNWVINRVRDGSVVLMHDLYRPTADASTRLIPQLKRMGFQMVTIEEMALLKKVNLKPGKVYFSFSG